MPLFKPNYIKMINDYLWRFNRLGPLNDQGFCEVTKGTARIGINVLPDENYLILRSGFMRIPKENPLPFFRKLLVLNFRDTLDAFFSIDDERDMVFVNLRRPLEGLDYEEFARSLIIVAEVSDQYDKPLIEEFGSEEDRAMYALKELMARGGKE